MASKEAKKEATRRWVQEQLAFWEPIFEPFMPALLQQFGDGKLEYKGARSTEECGTTLAIVVYACEDKKARTILHLLVPKLGEDNKPLQASAANHCLWYANRKDKWVRVFAEALLMYIVQQKTGCRMKGGSDNKFDLFGKTLFPPGGTGKKDEGRKFVGLTLPQTPERKQDANNANKVFVEHVRAPGSPPTDIAPLIDGLTAAAMLQGVKLEYNSPPEKYAPTLVQRSGALEKLRALRASLQLDTLDTLIKGGETGVVGRAKEVVEAVAGGDHTRARGEVACALDVLETVWATQYPPLPDETKLDDARAALDSLSEEVAPQVAAAPSSGKRKPKGRSSASLAAGASASGVIASGSSTPTASLPSAPSSASTNQPDTQAVLAGQELRIQRLEEKSQRPVGPVQFEEETLEDFLRPLGYEKYAAAMRASDWDLAKLGRTPLDPSATIGLIAAGVSSGAADDILRTVDMRRDAQAGSPLTGGRPQSSSVNPGSPAGDSSSSGATLMPPPPGPADVMPQGPVLATTVMASPSTDNQVRPRPNDLSQLSPQGALGFTTDDAKEAVPAGASGADTSDAPPDDVGGSSLALARSAVAASETLLGKLPCARDILALVVRYYIRGDGLCEDYAVLHCLGLLDHAVLCPLGSSVPEPVPTNSDRERTWRLRDQEVCYMEHKGVAMDKKKPHAKYLPSLDYRYQGTFQREAYGDPSELAIKAAVLKVDIVVVVETEELLSKVSVPIFLASGDTKRKGLKEGLEGSISVADVIARMQNPTDVPLVIIFNNGVEGKGGHYASGRYAALTALKWAPPDFLVSPSYLADSKAGKKMEKDAADADKKAAKAAKAEAKAAAKAAKAEAKAAAKAAGTSSSGSKLSDGFLEQGYGSDLGSFLHGITDGISDQLGLPPLNPQSEGDVIQGAVEDTSLLDSFDYIMGESGSPEERSDSPGAASPSESRAAAPSQSSDSSLPVIRPEELLVERDAGEMGKGAAFRKDCASGAILEVQHEGMLRGSESEAQAEKWEKDGDDRYITDCYAKCDQDPSDILVVVLDGASGRLCTLKDVYDECDCDRIHTPAWMKASVKCVTQRINDGAWDPSKYQSREAYTRAVAANVNTQMRLVLTRRVDGKLEIDGVAFVVIQPVKQGDWALTDYGYEYWEKDRESGGSGGGNDGSGSGGGGGSSGGGSADGGSSDGGSADGDGSADGGGSDTEQLGTSDGEGAGGGSAFDGSGEGTEAAMSAAGSSEGGEEPMMVVDSNHASTPSSYAGSLMANPPNFSSRLDKRSRSPIRFDMPRVRARFSKREQKALEDIVRGKKRARSKTPDKFAKYTPQQAAVELLFDAAFHGIKNLVLRCLQEGANPNFAGQNGSTPLHAACHEGHKGVVELLLRKEHAVDINRANAEGVTALMFAVSRGHTSIVELLLAQEGVKVNHADAEGWTALLAAGSCGNVDIVELLLRPEHGVDINYIQPQGGTALVAAIVHGHVEIVKLLLDRDGVDINRAHAKGATALMCASEVGRMDIVKLLLDRDGVDINRASAGGVTALMCAVRRGHTSIVELLLAQEGVKVNHADAEGRTALLAAGSCGNVDIVELLLRPEHGVDINHADAEGVTALMHASLLGYTGIVELLLDQDGVDINHALTTGGGTALLGAILRGYAEIVKLLLRSKHGVDINRADANGYTALMYAIVHGHKDKEIASKQGRMDIVKLLLRLEHGVDINRADAIIGYTALILASKLGRMDIVKLLLAQDGVDINHADAEGATALMRASYEGYTGIVELLLDQDGVDINHAANTGGGTALLAAIAHGHKEIVKLLLAQDGVDIHHANAHGWTALLVAFRRGCMEIVKLLLAKDGVDIHHTSSHGWTVLFRDSYRGTESIVEELLEVLTGQLPRQRHSQKVGDRRLRVESAQFKAVNRRTALMAARDQGHTRIVRQLAMAIAKQHRDSGEPVVDVGRAATPADVAESVGGSGGAASSTAAAVREDGTPANAAPAAGDARVVAPPDPMLVEPTDAPPPTAVVLQRLQTTDFVELEANDRKSKTPGLVLIRSGATGDRAQSLLNEMMQFCRDYKDAEGDMCFLYGEHDEALRKPILFGHAAKETGCFSLLRTNPARGIQGGVTARIYRGDGWLRCEIVLLKSRYPRSGVGSTLLNWVKTLLREEQHPGESLEMVVMALPIAQGFFEKQGFAVHPDAERKLHEIYDPFHAREPEEEIWLVDWEPHLTMKMFCELRDTPRSNEDEGGGDEGGSEDRGGESHEGRASEDPPGPAGGSDNGYRAFLGGDASGCTLTGQLASAWKQIRARKLECYDTGDAKRGWTVRTEVDIEPNGTIFVYGGELVDRATAKARQHKSHLRAVTADSVIDGIRVRELPPTHWGALPNSSSTSPNAHFKTIKFDSVRDVIVVKAGSKGIPAGESIAINYALGWDDSESDGGGDGEAETPRRTQTHTPTGRSYDYTEAEMKDTQKPSRQMEEYNRCVASEYAKQPLEKLVKSVKPKNHRAQAAAVVATLLDHGSFTEESSGITWVRKRTGGDSGNRLTVSGSTCTGFEGYNNVAAEKSGTTKAKKDQRDHTLRMKRKTHEALVALDARLRKEGHGFGVEGFDLERFANERLGAAFAIAYTYLMREMSDEVVALRGSCGPHVDSHAPDNANAQASFGNHVDDHAENDSKPGPYIEHTVVCQCSPGSTSMRVAGVGELEYKGVGGFVVFPAWAVHCTGRVEPKGPSLWKLTGFFEPSETPAVNSSA